MPKPFSYLVFLVALIYLNPVDLFGQMEKGNQIFTRFKKEVSLVRFTNLFKYEGGRVRSFLILDTSLIIWNGDGVENYFFSEYSFNTNSLVRNFVKGGRAKGEALNMLSAGILDNRTLWFYDMMLKKVAFVELTTKNNDQNSLKVSEFLMPGKMYYSAQMLSKNRFLGSGSVDTGDVYISSVLQEIDINTKKEIHQYGVMPKAPAKIPFNSWRDANQGFLYLDPSFTKAVLAKHYTDEVEFFNLRKKKSFKIKGPENIKLEFNAVSIPKLNVSSPNDKTQIGYVVGYPTNKYIYLMYLGIPATQNRGYKVNASTKIHVFDWNGNPVARINFSRNIMGFAVSKDNKNIYGFDPDTKFVIKASLPSL